MYSMKNLIDLLGERLARCNIHNAKFLNLLKGLTNQKTHEYLCELNV